MRLRPSSRLLSALLIAAAMALVFGAFAPRAERAYAGIDLTGQWELTFDGAFSGSCELAIFQTGADLQGTAGCSIIGDGKLNGTIDQTTGSFTISGNFDDVAGLGDITVELAGTASADGNTIQGRWNALDSFSGTFTATRTSLTPRLIDIGSGNGPTPPPNSDPQGLPSTGGATPSDGSGSLPLTALLVAGGTLALVAGWRLRHSKGR